jgi:hypothetical protein
MDAADAAGSYGAHSLSCKQLPGHQLVQHHQVAVAAAAAHAEAAASMHTAGPGSLGSAAAAGEAIGSRNSIFITQRATAGAATRVTQLAAAAAAGAAGDGAASAVPASNEEQEQGSGSRQASEGGAAGGSSSSRSRAAKSGRLAIIGVSGGSEDQAASTAVALSRR